MPRSSFVPSMRPHASGQGRVRVNRPMQFMGMNLQPGQDCYMGPWGSDEARSRYAAFRLAWQQACPAKPTMPTSTGMSVGEVALRFTVHAEDQWGVQSPNTWKIRSVMKDLILEHATMDAEAFRLVHLESIQRRLVEEGRLIRCGINRKIRTIVAAFRWAQAHDLVGQHVVDSISAIRPVSHRHGRDGTPRKAVPVRSVLKVVRHLKSIGNTSAADLTMLLMLTGARPGEFLKASATDVEFLKDGSAVMNLAHHKTSHHGLSREVVMPPEAAKIMRTIVGRSLRLHAPMFRGPRGRAMTGERLKDAIFRACAAVKVPKFIPYELRHTWASISAEAGASLEEISAGLGHSTRSTVANRYMRSTRLRAFRAAHRVADAVRASA